MASIPPPEISVSKDDNFTIGNKNISMKTAYYKFGTNVTTEDTVMEIITKDSKDIAIDDQIGMGDGNSYVVKNIDKTPVKFASGTPLVSESVSVRFPRPEAKTYAPEKIATFLIFKK